MHITMLVPSTLGRSPGSRTTLIQISATLNPNPCNGQAHPTVSMGQTYTQLQKNLESEQSSLQGMITHMHESTQAD